MAFPRKHLYNDEQIVVDLHPHWWFLVPRGLGLLAAVGLGGWALATKDPGGDPGWQVVLQWLAAAAVLGALLWFVARLVRWATTDFVVTTERCIYRTGFISKKGIEIPLDRINTVFFNQTVFERIIRAGDIGIESAGENSRQEFSDIRNPIRVQNTIYAQIEEYENRRQDRLGAVVRSGEATASLTVAEQIEKLADLRARGVLTDAEFEAQKARLLS